MTEGLTKREKFEDRYRELWLEQNKIDAIHNVMARPAPIKTKRKTETRISIKLSKQAEIINRMLNQRMLGRQIAELLGINQKEVSEIKKRYELPRTPEEIKDE